MGCARLADRLLSVGYRAGPETLRLVEQWRDAPSEAWTNGDSAAYLHRTNQSHDLDFVVDHIDDLPLVTRMDGQEVVAVRAS